MASLKLALIQTENLALGRLLTPGQKPNLAKLKQRVAGHVEQGVKLLKAACNMGAELVIFPELFTTGYDTQQLGNLYHQLSESKNGSSIRYFQEAAKEQGVYLQVGFPEDRGVSGVTYNSVAVIDPRGQLLGTYAKTHLFAGERLFFAKGNEFPVYQGEFGKFAPLICYDIGFPELARTLALKGADLFTISAAWCKADADIWQNNLIARTTDNLCFAAACNSVSERQGNQLIGNSRVYGPRGALLRQAAAGREEVLYAELDLTRVAEARRQCLYFLDRRPELYGKLVETEGRIDEDFGN